MVDHREVQKWLPMDECVTAMAEVFKMLGRGKAVNPLRNVMWLPDKSGLIGMMPAYLEEARVMGLKAISVFPGNHASEYDSHQGTVMLFETQNGRLLAMLDAGEITAIRTAAVSGVAISPTCGGLGFRYTDGTLKKPAPNRLTPVLLLVHPKPGLSPLVFAIR